MISMQYRYNIKYFLELKYSSKLCYSKIEPYYFIFSKIRDYNN